MIVFEAYAVFYRENFPLREARTEVYKMQKSFFKPMHIYH